MILFWHWIWVISFYCFKIENVKGKSHIQMIQFILLQPNRERILQDILAFLCLCFDSVSFVLYRSGTRPDYSTAGV